MNRYVHRFLALFVALCVAFSTVPVALAGEGQDASVDRESLAAIPLTPAEEGEYFKGHEADGFRYQDGQRIVTTPEDEGLATNASFVAYEKDSNGNYRSYDGSVIEGALSRGVDVSEWQIIDDWAALKADDISFMIIRCGGTGEVSRKMYEDSEFETNVAMCEKYGIPYGIYYYSCSLSVADAKAEAQYTLKLLKGTKPSLPVYYDLEYNYIDGTTDVDLLADMSEAFCDTIEAGGYIPGVYASIYWWEHYLTDPIFDGWTRWVAQYYKECEYDYHYWFWQAASDAEVDGIDGYVELNFNFGYDLPGFPDVRATHWAYKVVERAVELGIFNGYENGNFGRNDPVQRGQVATILWNMAGQPKAKSTAKSFSDVSSGAYYAEAVAWASSIGVVSGYAGTNKFGPTNPVTRQQLAVMLRNYAKCYAGVNTDGSATDYASMSDASSVASYARASVGWCFKNKIMSGSNGKVNPKGNATRAEAAKMVVFLYDLLA